MKETKIPMLSRVMVVRSMAGLPVAVVGLWAAGLSVSTAAWAQEKVVYRCPGNLYTDALSSKEAAAKGCKTLDGAPITVIQSGSRPAVPKPAASGGGGSSERVQSDEQKARDSDARRILETELKKEEDALAALQKEYNNGQPERRGDERNYQKYQDRVNEMKAAIARKEADVASLRRELAKFGASK